MSGGKSSIGAFALVSLAEGETIGIAAQYWPRSGFAS